MKDDRDFGRETLNIGGTQTKARFQNVTNDRKNLLVEIWIHLPQLLKQLQTVSIELFQKQSLPRISTENADPFQ